MKPVQLPPMPERVRAIIEDVAKRHGLHPTALVGKSRLQAKVRARCEAMKLIRALDPRLFSLSRIGKFFNRDHSTVVYSLKTQVSDSPAPSSAKAPRVDGPV